MKSQQSAGLVSGQPVNGAISIPYGIIFPELFEKKKKQLKKFFDTFCIFFLKSCLWLLGCEVLFSAGATGQDGTGARLLTHGTGVSALPRRPGQECARCAGGTRNSSESSPRTLPLPVPLAPCGGLFRFHFGVSVWLLLSLSIQFSFPGSLGLFI